MSFSPRRPGSLAATPGVVDCDQTYYPLRAGQKYVYVMAGRKAVTIFTKVDRARFTYESTVDGIAGAAPMKSISTGTCVADGITIDSIGMGRAGVKLLNRTGVDFGRPATMKVGGSWASGVTMEMTMGAKTGTITVTSRYKAIALETVRVPAGEYEALRIESDADTTIAMPTTTSNKADTDAKKIPKPAASHAMTTVWLAKGVGPIKMETRVSPASPVITTELVSFSR